MQALLSVFKGRAGESRDKETAVERCDIQLLDSPDKAACRFHIKMICGQGKDLTLCTPQGGKKSSDARRCC